MSTLVLMYHRVVAATRDPHELCVHPNRFAEHLEVLAGGAEVVPLAAVTQLGQGRHVAITFDDGYADVVTGAVPHLERHGMPATIFVVAGMLRAATAFWWDRLEHLVYDRFDAVSHAPAVRALGLSEPSPDDLHRALHARLLPLAPPVIHARLDELGAPRQLGPRVATLGADDLRALRAGGLFSIGSHTLSHAMLPSLDAEGQREELERSRGLLEELCGDTVDMFAYPFGVADGDATVALVRSAGYRMAYTCEEQLVDDAPDQLRLPRFAVLNWSCCRWDRPFPADWVRPAAHANSTRPPTGRGRVGLRPARAGAVGGRSPFAATTGCPGPGREGRAGGRSSRPGAARGGVRPVPTSGSGSSWAGRRG